jgi:hypothetical protein
VKGIGEIATDAEAIAKTATDKFLVPSNIPGVMASPGDIGETSPGKMYTTGLYLDGKGVTDTPTEIIKWNSGRLAVGQGSKYGSGVFQNILAVGYEAIGGGNVVGDHLVAVGSMALYSSTSGDNKTAVGSVAAGNTTSGVDVTALGYSAGRKNETGSRNTYLGSQSGYGVNGQSHSDNTFTGYKSGFAITSGGNNCIYGSSAGVALTSGANNVLIGKDSGNTITTQSYNTSVGTASLYNATGIGNTVLGYQSAFGVSGNNNIAIGLQTLRTNLGVSGSSNIAIGDGAISPAANDMSGSGNICIGIESCDDLISGNNNTAIGRYAGRSITTASSIVSIGAYSASHINTTEASGEVAIGFEAEQFNSTGARNTAIGYQAGKGATGNNHSDNTSLGYQAGLSVTTGGTNTLLGSKAGDSITSGSGNIIIGYNQDTSSATASNELNIGGTLYGVLGEGVGIRGSTGGFRRLFKEATANITADAAITIQVNIPTQARIVGCQLRVDAALATGETWDAKFNDGSDVETITTAAAVAKNTKVNFFSSYTTDAETDIVITKNGGGTFTAQGTIRAIVYYDAFDAMGDAP